MFALHHFLIFQLAVKSLERILCLLFEDQSNEKGISAVDEIRASFEKSLKSLEKSEDDKDILGKFS